MANPFPDPIPTEAPPSYRLSQTFAPPPGPPPPLQNQQYQQQPYQAQPGGSNLNRYGSTSSHRSSYSVSQPPPPQSPQAGAPLKRSNTQENQMAILRRFNTVFLLDDSASMQIDNRWNEAIDALLGIAEKVQQFDADGIDIHFLCSPIAGENIRTTDEIHRLFSRVRPVGEHTPTEVRIEDLLEPYVTACENAKRSGMALPKPVNFLVITDGSSDDPPSLAYALAGFAERLEEARLPLAQVGVQFCQIGNDPEATAALQELDDDLKTNHNVKRDIVDTLEYRGVIDANFLLKALLGGINRSQDNKQL